MQRRPTGRVPKLPTPKFQPMLSPGKVPYRDADRPSTRMDAGKRRQLEAILDTEKNKEERGRLGCILIVRLVKKFGSKHSALITFFVEEFLTSHVQIGKDDISSLEREISSTLNMKAAVGKHHLDFNHLPSPDKPSSPSTNEPLFLSSSAQLEVLPARPPSGSEWKMISSYQLLLSEEAERQEKAAARAKKMAFRKSLDEHMEEARRLHNDGALDVNGYASRMRLDIDCYKGEEKAKFDRIKQKDHDESDLRRLQIEEKQRKAASERQEALDMDSRNQQLNIEKMAQDAQKVASIRREKLEAQEKIKAENRENLRLRGVAKEAEAAYDQVLMLAYAAKLDREAIERENAFQMRMEQMGKHGQKFAQEGAGKAIRDAEIRTEQLLLKEQQRKEAADIEKEQKKEVDRRQRTYMQLKENERQIVKKKAEAVQQHDSDLVFKDFAKAHADAHRAGEEEKWRRYREKQEAYRVTLDVQVSEVKQRKAVKVGMSYVERGINRPTIDAITDDPIMLSRVMHRMRLSKSSQGARVPAKTSRAPF